MKEMINKMLNNPIGTMSLGLTVALVLISVDVTVDTVGRLCTNFKSAK